MLRANHCRSPAGSLPTVVSAVPATVSRSPKAPGNEPPSGAGARQPAPGSAAQQYARDAPSSPVADGVTHTQGCIRREGTSEAAPAAVRQAVGGGCQSGWGRLLSVTNVIEAGTCRQGQWLGIGWAPQERGGGAPRLPMHPCPSPSGSWVGREIAVAQQQDAELPGPASAVTQPHGAWRPLHYRDRPLWFGPPWDPFDKAHGP